MLNSAIRYQRSGPASPHRAVRGRPRQRGRDQEGSEAGAERHANSVQRQAERQGLKVHNRLDRGRHQSQSAALARYREADNLLADYVTDRGSDHRFAIVPKRTSHAATSCCRPSGHALAFIETLDRLGSRTWCSRR
jgi:hypothetical protein